MNQVTDEAQFEVCFKDPTRISVGSDYKEGSCNPEKYYCKGHGDQRRESLILLDFWVLPLDWSSAYVGESWEINLDKIERFLEARLLSTLNGRSCSWDFIVKIIKKSLWIMS